MQDLYGTDPPRKYVPDHADHTAPTRQHEVDHTDHTDHTDQRSICPEDVEHQVEIDDLIDVWTYYPPPKKTERD